MNEKMLEKLYSEYLENRPMPPEAIGKYHNEMHDAFENYICELEKYVFHSVFMSGYAHGFNAAKAGMEKGGVA